MVHNIYEYVNVLDLKSYHTVDKALEMKFGVDMAVYHGRAKALLKF